MALPYATTDIQTSSMMDRPYMPPTSGNFSFLDAPSNMPQLYDVGQSSAAQNMLQMAPAAASVASNIIPSGASAFMPALGVASAGISATTSIVSLIMQYQAMQKQIEENKRIEAKNDLLREQQIGREERQSGKMFALKERESLIAERNTAYTKKWNEEERRWDRSWFFATQMANRANTNINFRRSFLNLRRAD